MKKQKQFLTSLMTGALVVALSACGFANQSQQVQAVEQNVQEKTGEAYDASADGIVQTTSGQVQGTSRDGIYRYLGIPYAQALERFVPAQKAAWEGVYFADSYGAMSPQGSISGVGGAGDQTGTDNNCQNLNIWTPQTGAGEKRPVMVWLHGGSDEC